MGLMVFSLLIVIASPAYAFDLKEINSPLIETFLLISFLSLAPAILIFDHSDTLSPLGRGKGEGIGLPAEVTKRLSTF